MIRKISISAAALALVGCSTGSVVHHGVGAADNQRVAVSTPAAATPLGGQRGGGTPYEVVGSEVWNVPDPVSGRDYQIFVVLPATYSEQPDRRYPVLYVTDADYAFPLIRQMARRSNGEGPAIEDFILVGLSYALGEDGITSRRRDYTPTPAGTGGSSQAVHGQSRQYTAYLRDHVLPFVASRYRSDDTRRLFLGHSYGSLLGTQILLEQPALFSGYVLGSPSYWYDDKVLLRQEQAQALRRADLAAKVYLYVGEYESPQHGMSVHMVADTRAMAASLQSRPLPSLQMKLDVFNDEDHLSVAPRGFMHGLKYLLGVPKG